MKKLAIVPGSFDPMTLGHLDVVKLAKKDFSEVVVAVMVNAEKKTTFDLETRVEICRKTVRGIDGVRVISDTGLLVDLFDRLGADAVCKGVRNQTDAEYEKKMADWNLAHNPKFVTVIYPCSEAHKTLSSTEVRRKLEAGEDVSDLVHPDVLSLILNSQKSK